MHLHSNSSLTKTWNMMCLSLATYIFLYFFWVYSTFSNKDSCKCVTSSIFWIICNAISWGSTWSLTTCVQKSSVVEFWNLCKPIRLSCSLKLLSIVNLEVLPLKIIVTNIPSFIGSYKFHAKSNFHRFIQKLHSFMQNYIMIIIWI